MPKGHGPAHAGGFDRRTSSPWKPIRAATGQSSTPQFDERDLQARESLFSSRNRLPEHSRSSNIFVHKQRLRPSLFPGFQDRLDRLWPILRRLALGDRRPVQPAALIAN